MRKWAKSMGQRSHTLLNFLINGKRQIRIQHCSFLSDGLRLDSQEKEYFKILVQYTNAKSSDEKEILASWLNEHNPGSDFISTEVENFKAIANWVYPAILSICDLDDFDGSIGDLKQRLGAKVSHEDLKLYVKRLVKLELLKENDGRLCVTYKKVTTKDDVLNEGARQYHKNVMDLAKESIETLPLDQREFQSYAVSLNRDDVEDIKKMIRQFISKVSAKTQNKNTNEVYQLNTQFFRLTESSSLATEKERTHVVTEKRM